MGKQINFYMSEYIQEEFIEYLKQNQFPNTSLLSELPHFLLPRHQMLEDITYDVIYRICEMIDGYRNNLIKYSIVNIKNDTVVNDKIALHDWCEEYLKCTNI